jgi:hypothetical protein
MGLSGVINKLLSERQRREDLLARPDEIDNLVAKEVDYLQPVVAKVQWGKHPDKITAIDAAIPDDHPMKGFPRRVREGTEKLLAMPEFSRYGAKDIAKAVTMAELERPGESGLSTLEGAYKFKREADSGLLQFGENEKVKKLPGYEEWVAGKRAAEDKAYKEEEWLASPKDVLEAGAMGAGMGGVLSGLLSGGAAAPAGAVTGALSFAASEIPAHPLRKLLHGTEWYRAREDSGRLIDKVKLFAADAAIDAGGAIGAEKSAVKALGGLAKAGAFGVEAGNALSRFPSASNAVEAGKAARRSKLADEAIEGFFQKTDAKGVLYDHIKRMQEGGLAQVEEGLRLRSPEIYAQHMEDKAASAAEELFAQGKKRSRQLDWLDQARAEMRRPGTWQEEGGEVAEPGHVFKFVNGKPQFEPPKVEGEAPRMPERPIIRSEYPDKREEIARQVQGFREKQEADWRKKFGELDDESADMALQQAENGTAIDDAIKDASLAQKAVQQSIIRSDSWWSSTPDDIAESWRTAAAKKAKEVDDALEAKRRMWEKDNSEELGGLKRSSEARAVTGVRLFGEGKGSISGTLEALEGKRAAERMRGVLTEEDAKAFGYKGIKEAEDDLVKFFDEVDSVPDVRMIEPAKVEPVPSKRTEVPTQPVHDVDYNWNHENLRNIISGLHHGDPTQSLYGSFGKTGFRMSKILNDEMAARPMSEWRNIEPHRILDAVGIRPKAGTITAEEVGKVIGKSGNGGTSLKSIMLPMLATGSIALASIFGPDEAEASPLSAVKNVVPKVLEPMLAKVEGISAKEALIKKISDLRLDSKPVDPMNPFKLPVMQEQLNVARAATEKLGNTLKAVVRNKNLPFKLDRIMSPHPFGNIYYSVDSNPSVQLASMQNAMGNNTRTAFEVMENIFSKVTGLKDTQSAARKEAIALMEPVAKRYAGDVGAMRAMETQLEADKRALSGLKKYSDGRPERFEKIRSKIEKLENRIPQLEKEITNMRPVLEDFNAEWTRNAQVLAEKYPSARIALAAEDTADFKYYPWLKGKLSYEERAAVARIQDFHNSYAVRIEDSPGLHAIKDRPFVHHAWHPAWDDNAAAKRLAELNVDAVNATPYSKFHQRTKYSKMMVPEIGYNMERYIPDAEKRIQWAKFWYEGGENSWDAHMKSTFVQGSEPLRAFWNRVKESSIPAPNTTGNVWANRYAAFEVLRLIGFAPSVAFKHFFKNEGTWATLGIRESFAHIPEAGNTAYRIWARKSANRGILNNLGLKGPGLQNQAIDQYVGSFAHTHKLMSILGDFDLQSVARSNGIMGGFDEVIKRINDKGSVLVGAIESFDRAHSVLAATEMAMKRGMTAQQAVYGIYDTILKNNFLGGSLNPGWLKDPKMRTLMLFQSTPFKIWERRMVTAYRANRAIKLAGQTLKGSSLGDVIEQMRGLRSTIKEGEDGFKANLIRDALSSEKDFFGTPVTRQLVKEMILSGMIIGGGSMLGLDLMPQVGHLPFINAERSEPSLRTAPLVGGVFETMARRRQAAKNEEEPEFFAADFLRNWLGSSGFIPLTMHRAMRLSRNDIPEIYKDSPLQYIFSVPSK